MAGGRDAKVVLSNRPFDSCRWFTVEGKTKEEKGTLIILLQNEICVIGA
jgi:hypothetical protein